MSCNWELFELRVAIYGHRDARVGPGEIWWEFFNVSVDLGSLGIGDFQGSNDQCNFKFVFNELVKLKVIPFTFPNDRLVSDRLNFGNLQAAERNKVKLGAAKLYVHRRDEDDLKSLMQGVGVLLQGVSVDFTVPSPTFYAQLSGASAGLVN